MYASFRQNKLNVNNKDNKLLQFMFKHRILCQENSLAYTVKSKLIKKLIHIEERVLFLFLCLQNKTYILVLGFSR